MPTQAPYPTIFLEQVSKDGAAGNTYKSVCGNFVVKTSLATLDSRTMLTNEAGVYDKLPSDLAANYAKNYGLFHLGKSALALVLSYEGEPISFEVLSSDNRQVV
jgi:hypothetical protein